MTGLIGSITSLTALNLFQLGLLTFDRKGRVKYRNRPFRSMTRDNRRLEIVIRQHLEEIKPLFKKINNIPFRFDMYPYSYRAFFVTMQRFGIYAVLIINDGKVDSSYKREITRNISHELKTPLTSIRGYLETIIGNPLMKSEDRRYFLERALVNVERLEELIRDLSLLEMASDAAKYLEKERINLSQTIFNTKKNLEFRAEKNGVHMELKNLPDSLYISGHPRLLEAIFINLLENGIKYSRPGDSVTVEYAGMEYAGKNGHYHRFYIYDTGPGIPREFQEKIFERFYRIDSGRSRKTGGTGLGLSIVKHAVAFHEGKISIDKDYTAGLKYILELPAGDLRG